MNPKTRQNRDNTHENDKKEGYAKTTEHRGEKMHRRLQYNRRKDYLAEGCSVVFFFEL
jgi:hypothetical protein